MPPAESPSRNSGWEWAQAALLVANLAWTTLCLGGYRPETVVITSALTGLLLAVHLAGLSRMRRRVHPAGWWLLPFVVYAAANIAWVTPVRWLGWLDWFGWVQMIAVFWVVLNGVRSPAPRRGLFVALVALGVVAVVLACYQRFVNPGWLMLGRVQSEQFSGRASGPFGIPNSLAAFLLLLIPALGTLAFRRSAGVIRRVWCGLLALVLFFGLVLTISRGAWIGFALAVTVWPMAVPAWSWWRRTGLAVGVLTAALLAGGALYVGSPKVRDRFVALVVDAGERTRPIMWRVSWKLFREHPVWGSGGGSYNVLFEKHRPEQFPDEPQWTHNDYLNTLSDYGAAGFVLFFGAVAAVAARCLLGRRAEPNRMAGGWIDEPVFTSALAIGMLAFGLQLFVDFHFKIPALAMAFATVAGMLVGRAWPLPAGSEAKRGGRNLLLVVAGVGCAGAVALGIVPRYRGEALRYKARQTIDQFAISPPGPAGYRSGLVSARADLVQAVALSPANGQAWSDLSYATSLWAHVEPERTGELGREAEAAAERALAVSQVCPEFWIRRGVARDMQGRWLDAGNDFTQATGVATTNALVWYYYADHLSRKPNERGLAEAALALCLRLDPGNPAGLALRQRLAFRSKAP